MNGDPSQYGGNGVPRGPSHGEVVRSILKNTDVLCPHCGYNLRDMRGETCIECGERLIARELLRGAELPRTREHVLLQLSLAVWMVTSAAMIPFAPAIAPRGSMARPVISIVSLAIFVCVVWLTLRVLKHPRTILRLSRSVRLVIGIMNITTLLFAFAVIAWSAAWILSLLSHRAKP